MRVSGISEYAEKSTAASRSGDGHVLGIALRPDHLAAAKEEPIDLHDLHLGLVIGLPLWPSCRFDSHEPPPGSVTDKFRLDRFLLSLVMTDILSWPTPNS